MMPPTRHLASSALRILIALGAVPAALGAQARVTGALSASSVCQASVLHQTAPVADGGNHTISLDQRVCTWSPPIVIAGVRGMRYTATGVDDVQHDRSHDRSYAVGTMEDGDTYYLSYDGTATMNGPVPVHLEGRWKFTGGTGRLAGLSGGGSQPAGGGQGCEWVLPPTARRPIARPFVPRHLRDSARQPNIPADFRAPPARSLT